MEWDMQSITKRSLTQNEIQQIIKTALGGDAVVMHWVSLDDGMYNASYRLSVMIGDRVSDYVLKVAPPDGLPVMTYEQQIMQTEVDVYQRIHQETTVPVPEIIYADFDHHVVDSDWMVMRFLSVQPLNKVKRRINNKERNRIKGKLGEYAAQIHRIEGDFFGYPAPESTLQDITWHGAFNKMMDAVIADAAKMDLQLPIDAKMLRNGLLGHQAVFQDVIQPALNHFDLWDGNIFVIQVAEQWRIEGIVDCERAFYGDPLCDLVSSVNLFGDMTKETEFIQGMLGRTELTANEQIRVGWYRLYLYLIMYVETAYRQYGGWAYKSFFRHLIRRTYRRIKRLSENLS